MPDNTIILNNVPGKHIIFRNFRGKSTPVTREGDRSFCVIVLGLIRDQLAARGCKIKKLTDGTEFVNVAVRIEPTEQRNAEYKTDNLWQALDVDHINKADLEFTFHEYNINGKKGTKIYLKNARFSIKDLFDQTIIDIRWPDIIRVSNSVNNANNTEETNMEKMTRAEVMGQLQLGITAFEMQDSTKRDPVISKLMIAMKNAIEYIGEVPKSETKTRTVTVEKKVPVIPGIKQVIFNYPATVVIWEDDVKTVVECQKGDNYDMEKGLAMCIAKRMMGNRSNFNKQIRKYTDDVKNVQTKKKPKSGTFEERKAARMAQAEANKKAKGKSKARKGRSAPAVVNTDKMVVITEAYVELVRKKMTRGGLNYDQVAEVAGLGKSTVNRYFSPNVKCQKPKRMKIANFKKINKALNIRWRIEG